MGDFGFLEISGRLPSRQRTLMASDLPMGAMILKALVYQHLQDNLYTFIENQPENSVDSFGLAMIPPIHPHKGPCSRSQCQDQAQLAWDYCELACWPLGGLGCFATPAVGIGVWTTCESGCAALLALQDLACRSCPNTEVSIKQLQEVHARCHPSARQAEAQVALPNAPNAPDGAEKQV